MWTRIKRLFATPGPPKERYVHPMLGEFEFEPDLGWKRDYRVDGHDVEIFLGSNGEVPAAEMENTAADWTLNWAARRESVFRYVDAELSTWQEEWVPTASDRLVLSSIQVLWPESPTTSMLYFEDPEDDLRMWHVTYKGREPQGFAYDD